MRGFLLHAIEFFMYILRLFFHENKGVELMKIPHDDDLDALLSDDTMDDDEITILGDNFVDCAEIHKFLF